MKSAFFTTKHAFYLIHTYSIRYFQHSQVIIRLRLRPVGITTYYIDVTTYFPIESVSSTRSINHISLANGEEISLRLLPEETSDHSLIKKWQEFQIRPSTTHSSHWNFSWTTTTKLLPNCSLQLLPNCSLLMRTNGVNGNQSTQHQQITGNDWNLHCSTRCIKAQNWLYKKCTKTLDESAFLTAVKGNVENTVVPCCSYCLFDNWRP